MIGTDNVFHGVTHINLASGFRGGERQTELLIRALAKRGVVQRAIVRHKAPLAERLQGIDGVECREIATPWLPRPRLLSGALVHAHEARAGHLAHLTRLFAGRPYVITRRAWELPRDNALNRDLYRRAAAVVAVSNAVRDRLARFDRQLTPHVIHSAADPSPANPETSARLRRRWKDRFVVGHVGALSDGHKGQLTLIAAAKRLEPEIPELLVVFLGQGPDEPKLKEAAADCSHVEFAGFVTDVGSYLAAFDVFAFPSRYEALGSILLDALTAGLPIVASNVGGIPEAVRDGREGILVPPGDAEALAAGIRRLYQNPALREKLSTAASRRAELFTAERMADEYLALYRKLAPEVFS